MDKLPSPEESSQEIKISKRKLLRSEVSAEKVLERKFVNHCLLLLAV